MSAERHFYSHRIPVNIGDVIKLSVGCNQFATRTGKSVGSEDPLANRSKYPAAGRRTVMSLAAEYQTAQTLGANRGDIGYS
jgi:hypothetical protein